MNSFYADLDPFFFFFLNINPDHIRNSKLSTVPYYFRSIGSSKGKLNTVEDLKYGTECVGTGVL